MYSGRMLNRIRLVAIASLFFASPALAQTVLDGKGALAGPGGYLQDGALAAAKAWAHARAEPRHVAYAIARHFRDDPRFAGFLVSTKVALDPHGTAYEVPALTAAAEAMLQSIDSAESALAALQDPVDEGGPGGAVGASAAMAAVEAHGSESVSETTTAPAASPAARPTTPRASPRPRRSPTV